MSDIYKPKPIHAENVNFQFVQMKLHKKEISVKISKK